MKTTKINRAARLLSGIIALITFFSSCENVNDLQDLKNGKTIHKTEGYEAPVDEDGPITNVEEVISYYEGMEETKDEQPYTFIMNKYLDLAIFYLNGELSALELDTAVGGKVDIFRELVNMHNNIDPNIEYCDLGTTEFDSYFNNLYETMYAEIEQIPCIQDYEDIAVGFAEADGGGEMILEEDEPTLTIGGTVYSKVELLRVYEKGIALPYEYEDEYEDIDDPDPEILYLDNEANNLISPRKGLRYRLLALWPRTIRYRNYKCPNITRMQQAMASWREADNYYINFSQISDNGWNRFTWGIGCNYHLCLSKETDPNCGGSSTLCCVPWATIKTSPNSTNRNYLHELGHVLCFLHEMQRSDRDNYVRIKYDNIKCGYKSQFWKQCSSTALPICTFDFQSVMMYGQYAFNKNGQKTIECIDGSTYNQGTTISSKDRAAVRSVYHW